jgi:hypothetical protein
MKERRNKGLTLIEEIGVADELIIQINRCTRMAGEFRHEAAEVAFDLGAVGSGHPAPGPFEVAGLGELIVNLSGVDLPDEDAGAARDRIGVTAKVFVQSVQARNELRSHGDDTRLVERAHHLVNRRAGASNGRVPTGLASPRDGKMVAEGLGDEDGVADTPIGD